MLERNVRAGFIWAVNSTLMFENPNSQRRIRSFKNMNFLGTRQARSNPHEEKGDLERVTNRERAQVEVAGGGVEVGEVGEAAGVVEKGEEVTLTTGLSRARTKVRGVITTGNEATKRRWRGEGLHPDSTKVH